MLLTVITNETFRYAFTLLNLKKSTYTNQNMYAFICKLTFATVTVSKPRVATLITVTSLLVTWRVVQTVTTTVVCTIISIGTLITFYNRYFVSINTFFTYYIK